MGLNLDLADLKSIPKAAQEFLSKEDRLDVLVHNAGLMTPPAGSKTELVSSLTSFPMILVFGKCRYSLISS